MRPAIKSYELPRVVPPGTEPKTIKCNVLPAKAKLIRDLRREEYDGIKLDQRKNVVANEIAEIERRLITAPLTLADERGWKTDDQYYSRDFALPSEQKLRLEKKNDEKYEELFQIEELRERSIDKRLSLIITPCKGDEEITIEDIDFEEIPRDQKLEIINFFADVSNGNTTKSNDSN